MSVREWGRALLRGPRSLHSRPDRSRSDRPLRL